MAVRSASVGPTPSAARCGGPPGYATLPTCYFGSRLMNPLTPRSHSANVVPMGPVEALHHLFCAIFENDASGLRRRLRFGAEGDKILCTLPAETTPVAELADRAVDQHKQRGLVMPLLTRLRGPFPRRVSDINRVAALWPEELHESPRVEVPQKGANAQMVDIGILTIKDEEFEEVLAVFPDGNQVFVGPSHRHYNLRTASAGGGQHYRVAIVRQIEQGNGEAQDAARDLIEDLRPGLVLVVGIAGGVPSTEFSLGDVVLSLRIHDYSVEARKEGENAAYVLSGGPVARQIEGHVANLRARREDLGEWWKNLPEYPPVVRSAENFYGSTPWQKRTSEALEHHFGDTPRQQPDFRAGTLGASDRLIKDTALLISWLETSRGLLAVDMESGGVYRAARGRCAMLAIRGISDVVGFKRDERWTRFACQSAAAFARAYLRTRPILPSQTAAMFPQAVSQQAMPLAADVPRDDSVPSPRTTAAVERRRDHRAYAQGIRDQVNKAVDEAHLEWCQTQRHSSCREASCRRAVLQTVLGVLRSPTTDQLDTLAEKIVRAVSHLPWDVIYTAVEALYWEAIGLRDKPGLWQYEARDAGLTADALSQWLDIAGRVPDPPPIQVMCNGILVAELPLGVSPAHRFETPVGVLKTEFVRGNWTLHLCETKSASMVRRLELRIGEQTLTLDLQDEQDRSGPSAASRALLPTKAVSALLLRGGE